MYPGRSAAPRREGWGSTGTRAERGAPGGSRPASPKPFTCRRASASASSMARSGHAASPAPSAPSPAAPPRLSQTSRDRRPLLPGAAASGAGTQRRRSAAPGLLPGLRSRTRRRPGILRLPLRRRRSLWGHRRRPGPEGGQGHPRRQVPGRSPRAQRGGSERPAPPADRGRCGAGPCGRVPSSPDPARPGPAPSVFLRGRRCPRGQPQPCGPEALVHLVTLGLNRGKPLPVMPKQTSGKWVRTSLWALARAVAGLWRGPRSLIAWPVAVQPLPGIVLTRSVSQE